jgi:hypothetical protein
MAGMGPVAEPDAVRRLRVLASALRATFVEETVPVSYERVWTVARDLEGALPALLPGLRSFHIVDREGDRLRARARGHAGMRGWFDGVLTPGIWLLQGRFLVAGMALVDVPEGTRVAFLGAFRFRGFALVRPLVRPMLTRHAKRVIRRLGSAAADVGGGGAEPTPLAPSGPV